MKICKAGGGSEKVSIQQEMAAINEFSKAELSAEEVYTFSVVLCDNEVDRDFERFSESALEELKALKGVFEKQAAEKLPIMTQLPGREETVSLMGDEYKI